MHSGSYVHFEDPRIPLFPERAAIVGVTNCPLIMEACRTEECLCIQPLCTFYAARNEMPLFALLWHYRMLPIVLSLMTEVCRYSGLSLIRPPLGPVKVEGWPHFRGEFALLWDILKWPQYRGGLISGVQIRGSSLYYCYDTCSTNCPLFQKHAEQLSLIKRYAEAIVPY